MTEQEFFEMVCDRREGLENSVIVTPETVIVTVSFTPPEGTEIHSSNYFIKELKKNIPALNNIIIKDRPISVIMSVPVNGNERNNTIETIAELGSMAVNVISIIVSKSSIASRIDAIAKDCKPWFKEKEDEKG